MIINHLIPFEINISLLIDIVEKYRLEAEIEELVQTSFLGAETRYSENEALLNMKLKNQKKNLIKVQVYYYFTNYWSTLDHKESLNIVS
jgi:hypothetical protein